VLSRRSPSTLSPAPSGDDLLERATAAATASPRANAYLALEPGVHLHPLSARGVVGYRTSGRSLFAVGGVLGDPDAMTEHLERLRSTALGAGFKRVLLFPVSTSERAAVEAAGFRVVQVGSEAVVDPACFRLEGPQHADLRQMCNRARKRWGLRVVELDLAVDYGRLVGFFDAWRSGLSGRAPMRLVLGTPCLDSPLGRRYFGAENDGGLAAVVTVTPSRSGAAWAVDVMARKKGGPSGAMDLLLSETIAALGREGIRRMSLGSCPMSEKAHAEDPAPPLLTGIFHGLYRSWLGNRLFHFHGLAHFKNKFAPSWEPVLIGCAPRLGVWDLYAGCRMWGLFGDGDEVFTD